MTIKYNCKGFLNILDVTCVIQLSFMDLIATLFSWVHNIKGKSVGKEVCTNVWFGACGRNSYLSMDSNKICDKSV